MADGISVVAWDVGKDVRKGLPKGHRETFEQIDKSIFLNVVSFL